MPSLPEAHQFNRRPSYLSSWCQTVSPFSHPLCVNYAMAWITRVNTVPDAVCTVLSSLWWTEKPSETCRASYRNKLWNVVSCCLYSANILALHGSLNVKAMINSFCSKILRPLRHADLNSDYRLFSSPSLSAWKPAIYVGLLRHIPTLVKITTIWLTLYIVHEGMLTGVIMFRSNFCFPIWHGLLFL